MNRKEKVTKYPPKRRLENESEEGRKKEIIEEKQRRKNAKGDMKE